MTHYANQNPNPAPPGNAPVVQIHPTPMRRATSAETIRADRFERMLGVLLGFVHAEAQAAGAPDAEEALVESGLAIYEPYDPTRHGEIDCDPEPGDLIWRLTGEALDLIDKVVRQRPKENA